MPLQNVLLALLCPAPACLSVDCTKQRSFVWSSSTAAGGCWMNETSTPLLMEPITWYELFVVVWHLFGTRPRVRAAAQHTWRNCSPRVFCEWKNNIDRFGPLPPAQHSSRVKSILRNWFGIIYKQCDPLTPARDGSSSYLWSTWKVMVICLSNTVDFRWNRSIAKDKEASAVSGQLTLFYGGRR